MTEIQAKLDTLISRHRPGHALQRDFYKSREVYDADIARVWNRNWLWAGHASQIPNPGDYFLFDYGPDSVIVLRDNAGNIRAHLNICRHRGSRVCVEKFGNKRLFVCPYHAWTYELSGKLRTGQHMGPDFEPSNWGLRPVRVNVFQGLIFLCTDPETPSLEATLKTLAPRIAPFGLDRLKVARTATYPVPANWKLAVENYLECYHCGPSHQEYSRSHSLKAPADLAALAGPLKARSVAAGLSAEELDLYGPAVHPSTSLYFRRYPLYEGYKTGSRSGAPVSRLLGDLRAFDGGASDLGIGPLNWFLIYSDHMVGYRFLPRGLQQTDIEVVWMVHQDAEAGRDFDIDDLTWLWHVTSQDDERIIRHNQSGVNATHFQPGPLGEMESSIQRFYDFYFEMLGSETPARMAANE